MQTNLVVEAYVVVNSVTIVTTGRRFYVDYSGVYSDGRNSGQTAFDALAAPHSTTSGANVVVRRSFNVANIGYGNSGAGRVTIRGAGTIPTWSTSPDQRIRRPFAMPPRTLPGGEGTIPRGKSLISWETEQEAP